MCSLAKAPAPESSSKNVDARPVFPFTAIVGQEEMKLALILNIINPKLGRIMINGDCWTGTIVTCRALVGLLPKSRATMLKHKHLSSKEDGQ